MALTITCARLQPGTTIGLVISIGKCLTNTEMSVEEKLFSPCEDFLWQR